MGSRNYSTLTLLTLLACLQASCKTAPIPTWGGKLFNGDSRNDAISRNNPNAPPQAIKCASPAIDDYVCMSGADFKSWVMTYVYGCKEWKSGTIVVPPELLWEQVRPR